MSIELIVGCMFSGKTSLMFARIRRSQFAGLSTAVFKYDKDLRYSPNKSLACSHDGDLLEAIPVHDLTDVALPDADVIGIDEGQFIVGLPEWAQRAANAGKHVIISALDSKFNMTPWHNISLLMATTEKITKLYAVCFNCKKDAAFTKRINSDDQAEEVIGGADKYVASCRKCFNLKVDQK